MLLFASDLTPWWMPFVSLSGRSVSATGLARGMAFCWDPTSQLSRPKGLTNEQGTDIVDGNQFHRARQAFQKPAVGRSLINEIVRRRVDETGTKEPTIQRQGNDRILLQLPGVDDPERVKRLLGDG